MDSVSRNFQSLIEVGILGVLRLIFQGRPAALGWRPRRGPGPPTGLHLNSLTRSALQRTAPP